MNNILEKQGFEFEIGGGGCLILSRYLENEAFVWATCVDGGGLPDSDNWLVCAYGDDIGDILYEASSESDITLQEAINKALLVADTFWSSDTFWIENSLCRNGKPIADCDCC